MRNFWQRTFTAEGKARAKAERDYQACLETRNAMLSKSRRHASEQVSALYGAAHFLISPHHREFLALSEDGKHIVGGQFGDEFVPDLALVDVLSPEVTTRDISAAVNQFRNRLLWDGKRVSPYDPTPYEEHMRTIGYRTSANDTNAISDLRIEHNDEALSSPYATASKRLFDAIMHAPTPSDHDPPSSVDVLVHLDKWDDWDRAFHFRLSYFDDRGHSDERRRENRLGICNQVVPFVTRLTSLMGDGSLNDNRIVRTGSENDDIPI